MPRDARLQGNAAQQHEEEQQQHGEKQEQRHIVRLARR